jgi:hypothetical protein
MAQAVKFVAEIAGVKEVSLTGTADLAFWRGRLAREGLLPAESDGRAQLLLGATEARFMGIPFREFSIFVFVTPRARSSERQGAWLTQAFNSNWFFALVERVWFATPYAHGMPHVQCDLPAGVELAVGGRRLFRARMAPEAVLRAPSREGNEDWEGPIFLPPRRPQQPGRQWFYARLAGAAKVYPFAGGRDELEIGSSRHFPALDWLAASHFQVREWIIRAQAAHARSKTCRGAAASAWLAAAERSQTLKALAPLA